MNRRSILFWGGIAAALLLVGLLSGGRRQSGPPLDPDSTDPTGTRALVIFLGELGADVVDGLPDESTGTALLLADQLDDASRAELDDWIAGGGTLVVVDPSSDFSPPRAGFEDGDELGAGDCTLDGLDGLRLEATSFLLYAHRGESGDGDAVGRSASGWCFGDGSRSHLHVRPAGAGRIVALGGGSTLTNRNLDEADNAVLAARLLLGGAEGGASITEAEAEADGAAGTVAVLFGPIVAPGSRGLGDLIPSGAKWATVQLLVAFGLYVLWRLPRFGRPVTEPQPVELPASLLVRAAGELHRRAGGHRQASSALRADLDRRLRRRLRASPELPAPELVGAAVAAGPVEPHVVQRALAGPDAVDGDDLSSLLDDIDAVNHALLATNGDRPRPQPPSRGAAQDPPPAGAGHAADADEHDPTIGDHP